jgi:hypothetical protein
VDSDFIDEDEDDGDEPGVVEERLEQTIRENQEVEQRLLQAQCEVRRLKDRLLLAFRRFSLACHPDRGGSHALMVLVNDLLKPD